MRNRCPRDAGLHLVAVPLLLIIATGKSQFGWAIFAAFWTCLADTGGPDRTRRALLCSFVVLGSVAALVGSYIAGLGSFAGLSVGPALVALTALLPLRWPAAKLVATLLGEVAVVAAGAVLATDKDQELLGLKSPDRSSQSKTSRSIKTDSPRSSACIAQRLKGTPTLMKYVDAGLFNRSPAPPQHPAQARTCHDGPGLKSRWAPLRKFAPFISHTAGVPSVFCHRISALPSP
jgi:hypothetical protein